ncbi:MAG: ribonuclease Z [Clostridia bacterium]|nr:ribonuclease Z [Clostridia bacterium]
MARIHFLGTCSGTEPMEGMHHTSVVFEINGQNYFLDAGENCAYAAYLSGIDMMKTRAILISHMHIDHTGGFANLLFCLNKLIWRHNTQLVDNNTLNIYVPDLKVLNAIKTVACYNAKENNNLRFATRETCTHDGSLHEDENLRITALHNRHLGEDGSNGWHAYSFLFEFDGKRVVCSGDVHSPDELDALIGDGCDLLLMETGHHSVTDVCNYAVSHNVNRLRFYHHGREIIGDRAAEHLIATYPIDIKIAYDGMIEEI